RETGDVSLSDWPRQRGYEVMDRGNGFEARTNVITARGPEDDSEERPFVKLASPEGIYHEASFTVAREMRDPRQK
ncbi:hypothetical protein MMC28_011040, partial [Mycoblastus sanguinarius]|nr:hypothetical protein [Mycoblastus sanguinarius]